MQLTAEPLLNQEELITENSFRDGAVRIELNSPEDAFGHKSFPIIFPDTILHNAKVKWWKWWHKKSRY